MTPDGQAGTRFPAEWEPHGATWLAYPHLASDWPGKLTAARWAFAEFVRKLTEHETVRLLVRTDAEAKRAQSILRRGGVNFGNIDFHICPTNRSWLRDSGPTFVKSAEGLQAVCWQFDGWGRYANWTADARVGRFIADALERASIEPRIGQVRVRMEGGAIDTNGTGTILTTEQCLLSRKRHGLDRTPSRREYEALFREHLGCANILWLGHGIAGDDTSGHVDTIARFVGPRTIAAVVEPDPRDENYTPLCDNLKRLRSMRDEMNRSLDVLKLPIPGSLYHDGDRLPATYANFYIANGCVLVPTYNDPNDSVALRILGEHFRDREVCGIHSVDLVLGLGGLHCLAQPEPLAVPRQEHDGIGDGR